MPWAALSNWVISGMVGSRDTREPTSDSTRTMPARESRPIASTIMPMIIGTQIDRLR
ncbi:hypothetical protein D3C84_1314100 [compost metagenome]